MESQISKIIMSVVITAVVFGGGVYFWQNQVIQVSSPTKVEQNTQQANIESVTKEAGLAKMEQNNQQANIESVTEESSSDLFELAKNSKNEFTYLVSAPKLKGDLKMLLKNNYRDYNLGFSFTYSFSPWGAMRYVSRDLTASDGAQLENLPAITSYSFCAEFYACDEQKHEGMGFDLTFWNAKFAGRTNDPKFYMENGNILLKENDKYIVTYKPFVGQSYQNVNEKVEKLMSSFEIL